MKTKTTNISSKDILINNINDDVVVSKLFIEKMIKKTVMFNSIVTNFVYYI